MDIESKDKMIEQKDVLELKEKNLYSLDDNNISDSNNEYNLNTIYDEI